GRAAPQRFGPPPGPRVGDRTPHPHHGRGRRRKAGFPGGPGDRRRGEEGRGLAAGSRVCKAAELPCNHADWRNADRRLVQPPLLAKGGFALPRIVRWIVKGLAGLAIAVAFAAVGAFAASEFIVRW